MTKYYAKSPVARGSLEKGKRYPILSFLGARGFIIKLDSGQEVFCLFKRCNLLGGLNWVIGVYK